MNTRHVCLLVSVATLFAFPSTARAAWTPPIGIPTPSFGINEIAPAVPNPWTASTPGFYYVDATKTGATDSSNTYGTPAKPRRTIPSTLPAGSVVELHGTYDASHSSPATIVSQGTSTRPVYVRGVSPTSRPLVRRQWEVKGTYLIVENIEFGPMPDQSNTGSLVIRLPASHVVLRNSDLHGTLNDGGLGIVNWEIGYGDIYTGPGVIEHVVIYNNAIHDNGNLNATFDQDVHGITVSDHVNNLWVVDNQLYRNSGDGIQINAANQESAASTHHIYIGRNISHDNKQSGFWVKQATDVIFSQNEAYGHRPGNSSLGQCMGAQYAPNWVWFIYNNLHDCEFGIHQASDHIDLFSRTFIVGNLIRRIHRTTSDNTPADAWGPSAIMMSGGTERHVVNNTIYDVDSGVNIPASNGSLDIANNIIANVTLAQASHMNLDSATVRAATTFNNNLLFGSPRLDWGSGQTVPTASQLASWKSLTSDPQFVAAGTDFHLKSTSPAIGAGAVNSLYATFQQRYGISIAKDIDGTPRPAAYAIGSYDKTCTAGVTAPAAPQGLAGAIVSSTIALQWTASVASGCSAAPSYILEIGSTPGASNLANTPIGSVTTLSIPVTAVPPGSYYFRVRAQNSAGVSTPSNEVVLTFGGGGGGAPGVPGTLSITVTTQTTMVWSAPTTGGSVTGYIVEIGSAPGLKNYGSFPLPASPTRFTGGVAPRGTYYIRIRAQNSAGISGPTNEVRLVVP
jgi:hypothetical protein